MNSDKPIKSLEGRRSSLGALEQIEGNETINLNRPIGSLEGRRHLARSVQSERRITEGLDLMTDEANEGLNRGVKSHLTV